MTVTFGDSFYLRELSVIRYVISTIYAEGGACTGYIDEANICVLTKDEMSPAGGVDGVKIITEERFFEILGMNYDDIKRKISAPVKRYHGKRRKRTLPNGKKRNDNNNVNIKKSIDKQ